MKPLLKKDPIDDSPGANRRQNEETGNRRLGGSHFLRIQTQINPDKVICHFLSGLFDLV